MPMFRLSDGYPVDWPEIAARVKAEAGWRCVRCDAFHDPVSGHTLTVHHLDRDKANCRWWNILPLCQRCHLSVQGRVHLWRPWVFGHSEWFRTYVAGWYAWRYLGLELSRAEVLARLDELLELEARAVICGPPVKLQEGKGPTRSRDTCREHC